MEKFFKLKHYGTNVSTEVLAGLTTFFAMSYVLIVNPNILSGSGMPWGGVYLATIIATAIGTLIMALYANVPYAVAPGMGLNSFFLSITLSPILGFSWQEALAIVFICGLINILITVTNIRKAIIKAIPESLQYAIGGGIGIFVAYLGLINGGILINVPADAEGSIALLPALATFNSPLVWVALIGIVLTIILVVNNVKGAILIGIFATAVVGIPFGVTDINAGSVVEIGEAFDGLGVTFGSIFSSEGLPSLFTDITMLPLVLVTIFSFSMADVFDTIGTFIGTGRTAGIFSDEEIEKMQNSTGFDTRLDKAMVADSVATSIGAVLGTSNTTTYVESTAGIGVGGRTGLTSVVTAIMFILCIFFSPIVSVIPGVATAPALIIVGVMMMSNFSKIDWGNIDEAIPAFFASIFMGLSYSISDGIAFGFISYIIVKLARRKWKEINPVLAISTLLFVAYFVLLAI